MICSLCGGFPRTWQVACSLCKKLKWPYQVEKPLEPYTCVLCSVGGSRGSAARDRVKRLGPPRNRAATSGKASL